jgi:1,4-dihydroxy-2-naphthoate octaprenyltransferase
MATFAQWVAGARPRTLPAALAPVVAGSGAACALHGGRPARAALALVVSLALQVGVNFANDYSDGVRGTDRERVGPFRLTGSGSARPQAVRAAALASFAVAAAAGLALVIGCRAWPLLALGAACIAAAWCYTGGRHPYGYRGWGEVAAFLCFGPVAVLGTTYTQAGRISLPAVCAGLGIGALTGALLVANNLRDIPTDRISGKRTLAVLLGDAGTRRLYLALLAAAGLAVIPVLPRHAWAWLPLLALPLALKPLRAVLGGAAGRELVPVLERTGQVDLVYGILFGLALGLG